jgi:predicted transcriptional regulator
MVSKQDEQARGLIKHSVQEGERMEKLGKMGKSIDRGKQNTCQSYENIHIISYNISFDMKSF